MEISTSSLLQLAQSHAGSKVDGTGSVAPIDPTELEAITASITGALQRIMDSNPRWKTGLQLAQKSPTMKRPSWKSPTERRSLLGPSSAHGTVGATVEFRLTPGNNRDSPTVQWLKDSRPIPGETNMVLTLRNITERDYGGYSARIDGDGEWQETSTARLTRTPLIPGLVGQWDFEQGTLQPTIGLAWEPLDETTNPTSKLIKLGNTSALGLPAIQGNHQNVLPFPAFDPNTGFRVHHPIRPPPGQAKVNKYSIVMDILFSNPDNQ